MTYNSPFGPLRIDYGESMKDKNLNQLHFGLGYSFERNNYKIKSLFIILSMKILKKYLAISKNAQFSILIALSILLGCDITNSPEKLFLKQI